MLLANIRKQAIRTSSLDLPSNFNDFLTSSISRGEINECILILSVVFSTIFFNTAFGPISIPVVILFLTMYWTAASQLVGRIRSKYKSLIMPFASLCNLTSIVDRIGHLFFCSLINDLYFDLIRPTHW